VVDSTPAPAWAQGHGHGGLALRGEHGFSYSGTVHGIGPVASSGRIDFDGRGHASAWFTTVVGGAVFQGSFVGSYDVRGTFFTCTDPGYTVTGTTKRM